MEPLFSSLRESFVLVRPYSNARVPVLHEVQSFVGSFNSFPDSDESEGVRHSTSDLSFQNERAMWWAEFDSVGEDAVRGYVERNSYTPTGMEVARQWLARREFLQL